MILNNVKRISLLIIMISIVMASCVNLDDINNRLNDHEKRLKILEQAVTTANNSINNLQTLLDAQKEKISITSYAPLEDGSGYRLVMSDGSEIVLKNGTNGVAPLIGIKEFEGALYWTIDGEFMLDANGEKIKAEGTDGASGVTPKLRVNLEGYWEVSVDGGKSWTAVLDPEGNPVQAEGKDATVDLTITETDDAIIIIYNGQTFTIPKKKDDGNPTPSTRPILAIDYVAEYNINTDGTGFTSSHANDMSGYFNWDEAMSKFAIDKGFTVNGEKYHLPSQDEFCGIVPEYNGGKNIRFDTTSETLNYSENISIGGAPAKAYKADYKSNGDKFAYGLRYKDDTNDQLSAWRYALIDNPSGNGYLMTITVRYLGPKKASTTIQNIANEAWWESEASDDIVRSFPLNGIERDGGEKTGIGQYAMYWLSTEGVNTNTAYNMYIYTGGAHSDYSYSGKTFKTPIRLLKDVAQLPSNPDQPENNVKLPIEYLTEYNIAPDGISFVNSHKNNISGYYTSEEAIEKFSNITIDGKGYHLPSIEEWRGIINDSKINFKERDTQKAIEEEIYVGGKNGALKTFRADYKSTEDYTTYGLRFDGIDGDKSMLSAWKYQYVDHPDAVKPDDKIVIVTVRSLDKDYKGTIDDIATKEFWQHNNSKDIIRYIPMSGWINADDTEEMRGSNARFLSSTTTGKYCWYAFFTSYSLGLMDSIDDWYYNLTDKYTVRLFED